MNALNEKLFTTFKIQHLISSAYHPQTNGQDERTNRTIKTALGKLVNSDKSNWDDYINPIMFAINTNKQSSIKCSPYLVMFGRNAKLFCELAAKEEPEANYGAPLPSELEQCSSSSTVNQAESLFETTYETIMSKFDEINKTIKTNIKSAQEKQKIVYEKRKKNGFKEFTLKLEDEVLKRNFRKKDRKGDKWEDDWQGPYKIKSFKGNRVYLQCKNGKVLKNSVARIHIKPYKNKGTSTSEESKDQDTINENEFSLNVTDTSEASKDQDTINESNFFSNRTVTDVSITEDESTLSKERDVTMTLSEKVSALNRMVENVRKRKVEDRMSKPPVNIKIKRFEVNKENINSTEAGNVHSVKGFIGVNNNEQNEKILNSKKEKISSRQCHQHDDSNVKRKNLDKNEFCTVENDIPINIMDYSKDCHVQDDVIITKVEKNTNVQTMKNLVEKQRNGINTYIEMACLNESNWLDDRAIDRAQNMMRQQFADVEGLQSTIILNTGFVYTPSCQKYVQIYNYEGIHWLTLTKEISQTNSLSIYDSLGSHINAHLKGICAALLFSEQKSIKLEVMECHQQMGLNDCGLFSIANALAACLGEDPTTIIWDQTKMRDHLRKCFRQGYLENFPVVRRRKPSSQMCK